MQLQQAPVPSGNSSSQSTCSHVSSKTEVCNSYETEDENLWLGNCSYKEYNHNDGSNLFISWSGANSELLGKLQDHKLEVRNVSKCSDDGIFNVIFEKHSSARKAFLTQREVRLRMVPPKGSQRSWLRNPSPKFLVKFETRCRLVIKKGRAECHDIVGELLMSNDQEQKGCIIWANQLKGHRMRVVCCKGNFMFPGGKVVQMNGVPTDSDRQTLLGWISYRSRYKSESFVTRISGNKLSDYIYMK